MGSMQDILACVAKLVFKTHEGNIYFACVFNNSVFKLKQKKIKGAFQIL